MWRGEGNLCCELVVTPTLLTRREQAVVLCYDLLAGVCQIETCPPLVLNTSKLPHILVECDSSSVTPVSHEPPSTRHVQIIVAVDDLCDVGQA